MERVMSLRMTDGALRGSLVEFRESIANHLIETGMGEPAEVVDDEVENTVEAAVEVAERAFAAAAELQAPGQAARSELMMDEAGLVPRQRGRRGLRG